MQKLRAYFDGGEGIESEWMDAGVLGGIMLTAYLEEYGDDKAWDFIATERSGNLVIPDASGTPIVRYGYTFDGVYRDLRDGAIKLLETKTAVAISTAHLTLDDQAGSYWAVATHELRRDKTLGPKERIAGVNYNFLRKSTPDVRPRDPRTGEYTNKPTKQHYLDALTLKGAPNVRQNMKVEELQEIADSYKLTVIGDISKVQPLPNFLRHMVHRTAGERNTQLRRIALEARQMKPLRTSPELLTKTPRSTGHDACQHGCEFFNMCELQEAGVDWEQYRDAMYLVKDPYKDHRKSAHAAS